MKKTSVFLGFVFAGVVLAGVSLGGPMGCNTNELAGHGDDDAVVGTEQDAKDTATAAENIAFRSFTAAFGSPGALVLTEGQSDLILGKLKDAFSATTRSTCPAGTVVSPSGSDVTINGSVSGSCAAKFEGDSSNGTIRSNCTAYNDGTNSGEATVDGLIGAVGSTTTAGGESTFSFTTLTSNLLILTLGNGNNCSAVANMTSDVTVDNSTGSGSVSVGGCVAICGEAFDVTGSATF
jgi:hypothetical protein